jgi:hypothetical protein
LRPHRHGMDDGWTVRPVQDHKLEQVGCVVWPLPGQEQEATITGLLIGYAPVSTEEQDPTARREGLARLGMAAADPARHHITARPIDR